MSSQTSSSWALPAAPTHPKGTDGAFIGYTEVFRGTKLGIPKIGKRLDWAVIEASEISRGLMKYGVL
jgi:hypothetical protein